MSLKATEAVKGQFQAVAVLIRSGQASMGAEVAKSLGITNVDVGEMGDYDRCQLAELNTHFGFELKGVEQFTTLE